MEPRIGYQMQNVQWYVSNVAPGITPWEMAKLLTTRNGRHSQKYGYAIIHRAVAAGLIRMEPRADKKGCYRLFPIIRNSEKGI